MNEPKWTTHHVTMPEDKALEYLDKLLVVVNKQFLDPGYPIALSMAIDKMRTLSPGVKALTCEGCAWLKYKPLHSRCCACKRKERGDGYSHPPEKGE